MRALICRAWGTADDLTLEDVPVPEPGPKQIRIRVRATAANYADCLLIAGQYQTRPRLPFSPGMETTGVVSASGAEVMPFEPGQRVMAIVSHGGMAEECLAEASDCFTIPDDMPAEDAGAFPGAYLSSHVAIRWQGRLEAGETLLVLGAAGGVGLAAVEIGKAMGARVLAAASTVEKLVTAGDRGADGLINYAEESLRERVMALTDGRGVDVCFDPVGGEVFDSALSSLAWGGRIVLVGFTGGVPRIPANRLLVKHRAALGSSLRYFQWHAQDKFRRSGQELFEFYSEGKLRPTVTDVLPLARGADAIKRLAERRAHGRILVVPDGMMAG
jgi:NADPH2:quinone reductase